MPRFPYMNFPFPFYKNPPYAPSNIYNIPSVNANTNNSNVRQLHTAPNNNFGSTYNNTSNSDSIPDDKKNKSNKNNDDYLFDLFGLKIYYDDVLLVSLIYFLYSEGVKDDGLFIVLVLLLLS